MGARGSRTLGKEKDKRIWKPILYILLVVFALTCAGLFAHTTLSKAAPEARAAGGLKNVHMGAGAMTPSRTDWEGTVMTEDYTRLYFGQGQLWYLLDMIEPEWVNNQTYNRGLRVVLSDVLQNADGTYFTYMGDDSPTSGGSEMSDSWPNTLLKAWLNGEPYGSYTQGGTYYKDSQYFSDKERAAIVTFRYGADHKVGLMSTWYADKAPDSIKMAGAEYWVGESWYTTYDWLEITYYVDYYYVDIQGSMGRKRRTNTSGVRPSMWIDNTKVLYTRESGMGFEIGIDAAQNYSNTAGNPLQLILKEDDLPVPVLGETLRGTSGEMFKGLVLNGTEGEITFSVGSGNMLPNKAGLLIVDSDESVLAYGNITMLNGAGAEATYGIKLPKGYEYNTSDTFYIFTEYSENTTSTGYGSSLVEVPVKSGTFQIDVTASPAEGGGVSGAYKHVEYGQSHKVSAAANSGYTFVNWTLNGAEVSTDAAYTIDEVTEDMELTAHFSKVSSITIYPAGVIIGNKGSSVRLTAEVEGVGQYDNSVTWSITGNRSLDTYIDEDGILTIGEDESADEVYVTAVSAVNNSISATVAVQVGERDGNYYTIIPTASEGGSVSGGGQVIEGGSVTVAAQAEEGYRFDSWTIDGEVVSTNSIYEITDVSADMDLMDIRANFSLLSEGNVRIAIVPDHITVQKGESIRLTALVEVPLDMEDAVKWSVYANSPDTVIDEGGILTVGEDETERMLTVRAVLSADTSVYATASVTVIEEELAYYDITVSASEGGSVKGGGKVAAGGSITIEAVPDKGYQFDKWKIDDKRAGSSEVLTITNVQESMEYVAEFKQDVSQMTGVHGNMMATLVVADDAGMEALEIRSEKYTPDEGQQQAFENAKGEYQLGTTYDLTAWQGEQQLYELGSDVRVTITIPKAYMKSGREYKMLHIHNGRTEMLEDLDDVDTTVTISTRTFSPYALIFLEPSSDEKSGKKTGDVKDSVPLTGDYDRAIMILLAGIGIVAAAGIFKINHMEKGLRG